jgi:Family of unknown function (DUF6527)
MPKVNSLVRKYVEFMPERSEMTEGIIYISRLYNLAIHLCACGCGTETVTPLNAATGWDLVDDGKTISLTPSIGNQKICGSHYWIRNSKIEWC